MDFENEMTTVQTFIKKTAGLNSWRRNAAPSKLARPVVIWDSPYSGRARHLSRYGYRQMKRYYGTLYVRSVDECIALQEKLIQGLEDVCGVLPVNDATGERVGWIKEAVFEFNDASDSLDVPFTLVYEVAYARKRPEAPPAPSVVGTKVIYNTEQGG